MGLCPASPPRTGPSRAFTRVLAAYAPDVPRCSWLLDAHSQPVCCCSRVPPVASPTPHVCSPASALGICFVPSAIVWFIFAYRAMTLNWLLPLNSFHLALPTLSTKPLKEMQLEKQKYLRRRKTPSQQNVLLSPGSSAWVRFSQHSPATETQSLFGTAHSGTAGDRVTPLLGTEHLQAVPIRRAYPGSQRAGCLPGVITLLQKCAFIQLSSQDPYRPFSICCYAVLHPVLSSQAG